MYTFLPIGISGPAEGSPKSSVEEMNRAGAQEILMPMVQPGDLWQESGRWQKVRTGAPPVP
jgi:prolyl-tRNA synthetase